MVFIRGGGLGGCVRLRGDISWLYKRQSGQKCTWVVNYFDGVLGLGYLVRRAS